MTRQFQGGHHAQHVGPGKRAGPSSSPFGLFVTLALLVFLIGAEWAFMGWVSPPPRPSAHDRSPRETFLFRMRGFETTSIKEDRKVRLKIGALAVVPRKYFIFNIQPLNEALFEDFSIEYHRLPQNEAMFPVSDIQQTLLPYGGTTASAPGPFGMKLGAITRGIIHRFTLTVFTQGAAETVIKSEKAEIDFKSNQVRLEDATIEQIAFKRVVKAHQAVLKNSGGYVAVPGDYAILHPGGIVRGKGLKIGL
jgi:hypothetical protein